MEDQEAKMLADLAMTCALACVSGQATVTVSTRGKRPAGFPRGELLSVGTNGAHNYACHPVKVLAWLHDRMFGVEPHSAAERTDMSENTGPAVGSNDELDVVAVLRREFEAWAYGRDFDTTHSKLNPERYSNERTQGAWQAWGHGTANWRDQRDTAVRLLRNCEAAFAHFSDWPLAVELRATLRRSLGMEDA